MRSITLIGGSVFGASVALGLTSAAAFGGVSGPAFFVDGQVYRTVGTPTDLSGTGAPTSSFDTIYEFSGLQMNVATAAPGDRDYSGGRWQVHLLQFPEGYAAALASGDADGDGVLDSDAELDLALEQGTAVDAGVVKSFVCPVIRLP